MTLILSRNSASYILQVSDRLITLEGVPVDQASNKTIIYHARDAIVVMSYTGLAYISNIPTDQWIAETLIGASFDRSRKPPAMGPGARNYMDIGMSLRTLKEQFDGISQARTEDTDHWIGTAFDLSVNGWQWDKKGHARPVVAWLSKGAGDKLVEIGYRDRNWFYEGRMIMSVAPDGYINTNQLRDIRDNLSKMSPDEAESYLAGVIKTCSKKFQQIGSDCMSVLISPPKYHSIRVKYIPDQINRAKVISEKSLRIINIGFTPWMIGPNNSFAPSMITGQGWQFSVGNYSVNVSAPNNSSNLAILSSQDRQ